MNQLADVLRPSGFDGIVGQDHLFGERGTIRRMCQSGRMTNMIFFGPPGTGKTTAAGIIAKQSGMTFRKLNATSASLSDVKDVIAETANLFGSGGLLYFAMACAVSYLLSGYCGLYSSQTILYSKLRAEFINVHAK